MKKPLLDPNSNLGRLPIFRVVGCGTPTLSMLMAVVIGLNSNLEPDLSYTGFNFALFEVFKVPFAILAAGLTILGFIAAMHRSAQTALQIEKASEQNTFANFYKHRQEYVDHLNEFRSGLPSIISEKITPFVIRSFYLKTFPINTPRNLVLEPTTDWVNTHVKYLYEMLFYLDKLSRNQSFAQSLIILSCFSALESELRKQLFVIGEKGETKVIDSDSELVEISYPNGQHESLEYYRDSMFKCYRRITAYTKLLHELKHESLQPEKHVFYQNREYDLLRAHYDSYGDRDFSGATLNILRATYPPDYVVPVTESDLKVLAAIHNDCAEYSISMIRKYIGTI